MLVLSGQMPTRLLDAIWCNTPSPQKKMFCYNSKEIDCVLSTGRKL